MISDDCITAHSYLDLSISGSQNWDTTVEIVNEHRAVRLTSTSVKKQRFFEDLYDRYKNVQNDTKLEWDTTKAKQH